MMLQYMYAVVIMNIMAVALLLLLRRDSKISAWVPHTWRIYLNLVAAASYRRCRWKGQRSAVPLPVCAVPIGLESFPLYSGAQLATRFNRGRRCCAPVCRAPWPPSPPSPCNGTPRGSGAQKSSSSILCTAPRHPIQPSAGTSRRESQHALVRQTASGGSQS